ncbi:MAG TPA: ATP-binding cassette domain-containing protein [Candidatus Krumholzibacteriaceae bacterium]|nr:ATP-binding cassette domain-containing protein [Candidatus Krumholzibacteriaceae bacterium]
MAVIETKDLTYTYQGGTKPSIRDVSIKIEKGEFVILTGPSGCGKTTLCRCFNGLIPHFYNGTLQGAINVAGFNIVEHQIHELALHVGFVFQNPENQLFALSVEKDVAFALENLGTPREEMQRRVEWALKTVGAYEFRERAPHELSGGQQQRVAIASVLAMQPDVLVLDEPTSFLDPLGAKKIFEVIADLNKRLGKTVILVEHRLDLTAQYASHVVIMDKGAVVLDGKPRNIFNMDEARLIGVGIPKATRLFQILKEDGIHVRKTPISSEEAAEFLRSILTHD